MSLSFKQLFLILFIAFSALLAASLLQAWTGPSAAAPNGNVAAPINVGTTDQVKNGGIAVSALLVAGNASVYASGSDTKLGVNTSNPLVALDVNGSVRIGDGGELCQAVTAGSLRYNATSASLEYCNGTAWSAVGSGSSFGAWQSKELDTVYQASTDGIVTVAGTTYSGWVYRCIVYGYTDSSNPPTTIRVQDGSEDNSGSSMGFAQRHGFSMPVRAGDYWKISQAGQCINTVQWIPLSGGSGGSGGTTRMSGTTYTKVGTASGGTLCDGNDVVVGAATDDTNKIWLTCRVVDSL